MAEVSTTRKQRIAIWGIALVMAVGTILTFVVMVIAQKNPDADPTNISQQKLMEEYQKQQEEQQKKLKPVLDRQSAATTALMKKYPAAKFDASKVESLKVETLADSGGEVADKGATLDVIYYGWTPDGKVFDSTESHVGQFSIGSGVIKGWIDGLKSAKYGAVYKLTVPSDSAYGSTGSQNSDGSYAIKPDTPLQFVVKIEKVSEK